MAMDDLSASRLHARLQTTRFGRSCEIKDVTASTNDDARAAATGGAPDGHLVVADRQTRGRGSRGRDWISPGGTDLYLSVVARLPLSLAELAPLTLAVGLAVAETSEQFLPATLRAAVKWPNDVWMEGHKLAGILLESASLGSTVQPLVIGIGLNVNRTQFTGAFDTPATSLALAGGSQLDRGEVLAALLLRLEQTVDRFLREGLAPFRAALTPRLALRGERVRCEGVEGVVEDIGAGGALRVRTADGLRELSGGRLEPM